MTTSEIVPGQSTQSDDRDRILLERAHRLAQRPPADDDGSRAEVLLCRVRTERYAVEPNVVQSVQRSAELTPVPRTYRQVAGVLNVRGELFTVLDLGAALGLEVSPAEGSSRVLLVELSVGRVGILVDDVYGVEWLSLDQLDPSLPGQAASRGIAQGSIVLLNLEQLMAEQNFDGSGAV
jgi:purine-binding chemotaxis protein CheW